MGRGTNFPFATFYNTLSKAGEWFFKYNAIYAILFLSLSFFFLIRKEYYFFVFAWIVILLPLCEGTTIAQPRYISIIFRFSILFGTYIARSKFPSALIVCLLALQLYTYSFWAITDPFSY
jgi:hypothetical protein